MACVVRECMYVCPLSSYALSYVCKITSVKFKGHDVAFTPRHHRILVSQKSPPLLNIYLWNWVKNRGPFLCSFFSPRGFSEPAAGGTLRVNLNETLTWDIPDLDVIICWQKDTSLSSKYNHLLRLLVNN